MTLIKINKDHFIYLIAIVYLLLSYRTSFSGYFIWDDKSFLFHSLITHGSFLEILYKPHYGLYHPITTLYVKFNYILHGNDSILLHFLNIFIHIINSLLVFYIARQFKFNGYIAFIVFLFHPLTCEVTFWITSIKDLLFVLFSLSGILAYLFFLEKPKNRKWHVISTILIILAFLSKVQAAFLPYVLIVIDYVWHGNVNLKTLIRKTPLIIIGTILIIINVHFRGIESDLSPLNSLTFLERIMNAGVIFAKYVIALVFPFDLSIFYPRINYGFILTSVTCIFFLTTCILIWKKASKETALIFVIFVLCLTPVLQIMPIGESEFNDRYAYFALAIFCITLEPLYNYCLLLSKKLSRTALALYLMFIVSSFIYQNSKWLNQVLLFESSFKRFPKSEILANTLGVLYLKQDNMHKAKDYLNTAIELEPTFAQAYYNRGLLFEKSHDYTKSISSYHQAVKLNATYEAALFRLSELYYKSNNSDSASMYAYRLLGNSNARAKVYDLLGKIEYAKGDISKSIQYFEYALKIESENPIYLYNLANSHGLSGDYTKAIDLLNKSINIDPSFHEAYYLRGIAKLKLGLDGCNDVEIAKVKGNEKAVRAINALCH